MECGRQEEQGADTLQRERLETPAESPNSNFSVRKEDSFGVGTFFCLRFCFGNACYLLLAIEKKKTSVDSNRFNLH